MDPKQTALKRYALKTTDSTELYYVGEASFYGIGNRFDNLIVSLDGDDTLNGSRGADTLVGGEGNDIYYVDDEADVIIEESESGLDTVWSYIRSGSYTLPDNVENLVQRITARGGGTLIGNDLDNKIVGASAAETIDGGGGFDTVTGGRGLDTFIVSFGETTITDLGNGGYDNFIVERGAKLLAYATSNWVGSVDVINEGEVSIQTKGKSIDLSNLPKKNGFEVINIGARAKLVGSAAIDTISGGKYSDTIQGFGGDDVLAGGAGSDSFLIDSGKDTIIDLGLGGGDSFQVYLGAKLDAVLAANWVGRGSVNYAADGETRLFANGYSVNLSSITTGNGFYIENAVSIDSQLSFGAVSIWGSAAEDTIIGGNANDTIFGGRGDDRIIGQGGRDRIDAGPGSDTVVISAEDVSGDTLIGGDGVDTLEVKNTLSLSGNVSGFESVALMADTSTSPPAVTTLTVSPQVLISNSLVSIKGSSDSAATEELVVAMTTGDIKNSRIDIDLSKVASLVDATVVVDSTLVAANATVTALGTSFGDRFKSGSPAAGITVTVNFDGGAGSDTMDGGAGADSFLGNNGADSLSGGDGADTLSGGAGVDTLLGGNGDDWLIIQAGDDTVGDVFDGGSNDDTLLVRGAVNLWDSPTTVSNVDRVQLAEGASLTIDFRAFTTNHNYPDYIFNNILTVGGTSGGSKETATIITDKYNGPAHDFSETINLSHVQVIDAILAIEAYGGADAVTGSSTGANSIDGGSGADTITGGSSDDVLMGGGDNDSIVGNDGADTIQGGEGVDTLTGNRGNPTTHRDAAADTFVYTNYTEAPIGTPTWIDAAGQGTKLVNGVATPLAFGDPLVVDAIDYGAESIIGFEVAKDYLDLPDGGTDLPEQIKAIPNTALLAVTSGSLDIKPYQQTDITISATHKYQVLNGVLKVWSDANRTVDGSTNWALHNWLALVDSIADTAISPAATGGVIVFEYKVDPSNSDTYVFARGGTTSNDLLIRLAGVTGITAFSEQSNGLSTTLAGG